MKKIVLVLLVAVASAAVARAQNAEYSFKESYPVSEPSQLSISSSDGNIEVVPGTGTKMEVFYMVRKGNKLLKINRADLAKDVTLVVVPEKNSLTITVKYPQENWSFTSQDRIRVNFRVEVPRQTICELRASDGNIDLRGLSGTQDIKTSDGNIIVKSISGNVIGKSSDGNVTVADVQGIVEVRTSDGRIQIDNVTGNTSAGTSDGNIGLTGIKGDVSASSSDGQISFESLAGSFKASTSDGNVHGTITSLQKELSIRTSDGNIDVTIPDRLGLDLDIKGESLNVPLANFSGSSEDKQIRGKTNGGGIPVHLSTDGNVSLRYQ